jgi:GNAT superfamily N-acetyltransferase
MCGAVSYAWRGPITDDEMVDLVKSYSGRAAAGWWDQIRTHSLGWIAARNRDGLLVGFVNVAWDGGDHAFLIDTRTRGGYQRQGVGAEVVRQAAPCAKAAGCEWLHVDFEAELAPFYLNAGGFRPTDAGLIHLYSLDGLDSGAGNVPRSPNHGAHAPGQGLPRHVNPAALPAERFARPALARPGILAGGRGGAAHFPRRVAVVFSGP